MEPLKYSDTELLAKVAEGEETAFRIIFDKYADRLYSYICTFTGDRESARDQVQDIFLNLWRLRSTATEIENLNAYLHKAARNSVHTGFRKLATQTLIFEEIGRQQGESTSEETDQLVRTSEVRRQIAALVDRLTPQQRRIFQLSREEGMKIPEIATLLGLSVNTVKTHLGDALRFLRQELLHRYGPDALILLVIFRLH